MPALASPRVQAPPPIPPRHSLLVLSDSEPDPSDNTTLPCVRLTRANEITSDPNVLAPPTSDRQSVDGVRPFGRSVRTSGPSVLAPLASDRQPDDSVGPFGRGV
jgi:hypothetical protein